MKLFNFFKKNKKDIDTEKEEKPNPKIISREQIAKGNNFHKFLLEPTNENFLIVQEEVFNHPNYDPYSDDLNKMEKLLKEKKYDQVVKNINTNILLSPKAHFYLAFAFKKLGDENAENAETYIFQTIVESIKKTGDGTKENPYRVTRISDERDLIQYLKDDFSRQTLIEEENNVYDLISCDSGKQIYFDVTRPYARLEQLMSLKTGS
ncbi:DUF4919 domain-containing protein [Aureivirga sp. CE67]|uniref:DUF4919 domain-containing protein n=1 Tax=Aureivirga sp. CE67 TaxID=1788983 RepID=UPI0018C980B6|nr:DUF4919 domain-containing protein [Aureivirga sp. CE67]